MQFRITNTVVTFGNPGPKEYVETFDVDVDHADLALAIARREADATCTRLGKPATVRTDVRKMPTYANGETFGYTITVNLDAG